MKFYSWISDKIINDSNYILPGIIQTDNSNFSITLNYSKPLHKNTLYHRDKSNFYTENFWHQAQSNLENLSKPFQKDVFSITIH